MSAFIAALPMYDWPERRAEVDAEWATFRARFRDVGIDAPANLVRRNADMPPVPGGIRAASGAILAPDPATLPPHSLDFHTLWLHPQLLVAQTCWGPMELGLASHVRLLGQPDYSDYEGGQGELYSSAIVMRAGTGAHVPAPADGAAVIPVDRLRGKRFAFNSSDSMSGVIALSRDLDTIGESLDLFSDRIESGGHRNSIAAVAEAQADVAAIDCRSWDLAQRFESSAKKLTVVGWTALRKGLPFIAALRSPYLPWRLIVNREVLNPAYD